MRASDLPASGPSRLFPFGLLLLGLLVASPARVLAAVEEDSLICAKVKDSYAVSGYTAAFWPRSEAYGAMTWCDMKVKAVEHCVPVETVLHDTTGPYEGYRGPTVRAEYTCYRIRCRNDEGSSYLGHSVEMYDTFGERLGNAPQVRRVCLPNP
ncbi:MAG: hypothetical protein ABR538_02170 [Candidatus Binatia bacterium]